MISVLCVTQREPYAVPFLKLFAALANEIHGEYVEVVDGWDVQSNGTIESVLDNAIGRCKGDYILRLDDDELPSHALIEFLKRGEFDADLYAFPRANLWKDEGHFLANPPLWPDYQTRLTTKEKAGGRRNVHDGSPYGTGKIVDAPIYHHKFLVRSYQERRIIAERYEALRPGAGLGTIYLPFGLPEEAFARLDVQPLERTTDGKKRTRKTN